METLILICLWLTVPTSTQPPTLSGQEMTTGQSAVMLCSWLVKIGMAHSTCGCTCGWQVKLCDPSLTHAIFEHLSGEVLSVRRYTNVLFTIDRQWLQ